MKPAKIKEKIDAITAMQPTAISNIPRDDSLEALRHRIETIIKETEIRQYFRAVIQRSLEEQVRVSVGKHWYFLRT
jgi:hypothetical protein